MDQSGKYCQHAICRDDTAGELLAMAQILHRRDLFVAMHEARGATVRCRLVPRKGPVHAPLPPAADRC